MYLRLVALLSVLLIVGCHSSGANAQTGQPLAPPVPEGMSVAIFAGGCFWCMEGAFEDIEGVSEVLSGFTGGTEANPTYHEVSYGQTSHTEAVWVVYDPSAITYSQLLDVYWRSMDPTDLGGQFADRGTQYRPAIFVANEEERAAAEQSKQALQESGVFDEPIVVPIVDAGPFYVAEDYHQNYFRTNSAHYQRYREASGRGPFLRAHWSDAH
ncbi:MAG: peptide-methionine (S)-S-oxide reductase MsrA [Myxococcales bacterium]|nr:peptide-methionine (S)-S-oxide reductase MsrA [Myxococcales bacterium]